MADDTDAGPGVRREAQATRGRRRADGASLLAGISLLYVEDDVEAREQLAQFLRRRVRTLHVAGDGLEALALFERHRPDVVLTDILMPRMDGLTMVRHLKALDAAVPVVITSALSESRFLIEAIELGVERYVLKPVDTRRLVEVLEFCVRAARSEQSGRLAQAVLTATSDAVAIIAANGIVTLVNPAFVRVTGWAAGEVVNRPFEALLDPEEAVLRAQLRATQASAWRGEFRLRSAAGAVLHALGSLDPLAGRGAAADSRVLVFFDNGEARRAHAELQHLARADSLTGLSNRLVFDEALDQTLVAAASAGRQFALLFVDLDRFKQINDRHGHAAGDALLREVGRRLSESVREADLTSRRGGDEFVILLRDLSSVEEAHLIAERVRAALEPEIRINGLQLTVRCSVGVAIYPLDGRDARSLLRQADAAMYGAKAAGGDRTAGCLPPGPLVTNV
jgi:diguanylate cyclase (GGDEF)-like protein/PAS domain S-box-containing protein